MHQCLNREFCHYERIEKIDDGELAIEFENLLCKNDKEKAMRVIELQNFIAGNLFHKLRFYLFFDPENRGR